MPYRSGRYLVTSKRLEGIDECKLVSLATKISGEFTTLSRLVLSPWIFEHEAKEGIANWL